MARRLSIALLLAGLAAPAFAVEPAPAPRDAARVHGAEARKDREAEIDRHCLRETGTRLRHRAGERRCTAFSGRVWTREDLQRTGHVDLADALRTLDVSIR